MYEASVTPFPFWGARTSAKMGRDPLAVQNSSVVIYSSMIAGITNVTGRVRYNGFFCWLLTFIAERLFATQPSEVDNPKLQIKYVRRAELLLAYVMTQYYPLVLGVNGKTFAQKHIDDDQQQLFLAEGADMEICKEGNEGKEGSESGNRKNKVYWQNRQGVFGQYYVGVLSQLRLLYMPDAKHRTYRVTGEGRRLCQIFRKCLGDKGEDDFWDAVCRGRIDKSQLALFKDMALHMVTDEEELQEYQKIFCDYDTVTLSGDKVCHRLNTMKMLLRYIMEEGRKVPRRQLVLAFLKCHFLNALDRRLEVDDEGMAWFLYELNELAHAAYESFHFAVLYSVTEEPQPLGDVLARLADEYQSYKAAEPHAADIYGLYERLGDCYQQGAYGALTRVASQLLFALRLAVDPYLTVLCGYARANSYDTSHTGFAPTLLARLVGPDARECDWDFTEDCVYMAINDHLRSSYSKSTIGQGVVHNYMVEDGLIWLLRRPEPIRTSPRLQNVILYMEDMGWIECEGDCYKMTNRGQNVLKI